MKIERVFTVNELNKYTNKVNKINKSNEVVGIKDSIEITSVGKLLSAYAPEKFDDKSARIQELKEKIASGTYNIDPKLTAQSMINSMY